MMTQVIGLISGTSVDGIDAALVEICGTDVDLKVKLLSGATYPYPAALREQILEVCGGAPLSMAELAQLDDAIALEFAQAAQKIQTGDTPAELIGSHGQTVYHRPRELKVERLNVESSNQQPSNLQPSNLQPPNLQNSNLQHSNLQPSNLQPSNLQPSNLQPSNLQPSNLQPSNLQPATSLPPVTLSFEVEDTGPGIAPDELDTLFDAFVQTESGRKSQEGTGLGLAS